MGKKKYLLPTAIASVLVVTDRWHQHSKMEGTEPGLSSHGVKVLYDTFSYTFGNGVKQDEFFPIA